MDVQTDQAIERQTTQRDPFLTVLGERVRSLRARKGLARRALASVSDVSERHLANLESGVGNPSVLVLRQVARALDCELMDLLGNEESNAAERLLIRELLRGRGDAELRRARLALARLYDQPRQRHSRIALVGLRGAGKTTLGRLLADELNVPFVELNKEIERVAGCGLAEIHNLLGPLAYRRYEHRALEESIQLYPDAVIATPGGLVSDPATLNLLLSHCRTVWLRATPAEHMRRVIEQGDLRPMAGNAEAMEDLRRILLERAAFYGKADLAFDTSGKTVPQALAALRESLQLGNAGH